MVRVLLADNDPVMLAGLAVIVTRAGMAVTGQVQAGSELVRAAMIGRPDVVVGDFDQFAGVSQVVRAVPGTALLMFTARDDSESVRHAIKAGVRGYLHKSASPSSVVRAIESVAAGEVVLAPHIADQLRSMASGSAQDLTRGLTERQREILRLVGEGLGNSTIAARLGIAAKTVGNQVPSILAKLGIPDRAAAILHAHHLRPYERLLAC